MKRITLLLTCFLLVPWVADAQLLGLGVRLGIGTGNYEFDSVPIEGGTLEPAGNRVSGYQAAVFLRLSIPTFIYLQPELQLSQRDYIFGIKYPKTTKEFKDIRTYRLDVPLLLGFKLGNVRLFGGPVWRIGSKQYSKGSGPTPLRVNFDDNSVAAMGGIGVEFDGIFFEVRYTGYMEQTTAQLKVAEQRKTVDVTHDSTVQINFGLFF